MKQYIYVESFSSALNCANIKKQNGQMNFMNSLFQSGSSFVG